LLASAQAADDGTVLLDIERSTNSEASVRLSIGAAQSSIYRLSESRDLKVWQLRQTGAALGESISLSVSTDEAETLFFRLELARIQPLAQMVRVFAVNSQVVNCPEDRDALLVRIDDACEGPVASLPLGCLLKQVIILCEENSANFHGSIKQPLIAPSRRAILLRGQHLHCASRKKEGCNQPQLPVATCGSCLRHGEGPAVFLLGVRAPKKPCPWAWAMPGDAASTLMEPKAASHLFSCPNRQ
jgi:hypothetical protein